MDVSTYRSAEQAGKRAINAIRLWTIHNPVHFDGHGFPVRVDTLDDLRAYVDVMHETMFESFMTELEGLHDHELDEVVDALVRCCRVCLTLFGPRHVSLPLSGMLGQYAAARKLRGIERRARVLEIGPGSGLISFFLERDPAIERYHQVETAEAFYLLQSWINRQVYGHRFLDHAQASPGLAGAGGLAVDALTDDPVGLAGHEPPIVVTHGVPPRAEHFPWWQLERVAANSYDVVMANANLTEFSEEAMRYYAALIAKVLAPDGVLLVQGTGGGTGHVRRVMKDLMAARLVPFMIGEHIDRVAPLPAGAPARKTMYLTNALLLPVSHPALRRVALRDGEVPIVYPEDPLTRSVYALDRAPGPKRSREDVARRVVERLRAEG